MTRLDFRPNVHSDLRLLTTATRLPTGALAARVTEALFRERRPWAFPLALPSHPRDGQRPRLFQLSEEALQRKKVRTDPTEKRQPSPCPRETSIETSTYGRRRRCPRRLNDPDAGGTPRTTIGRELRSRTLTPPNAGETPAAAQSRRLRKRSDARVRNVTPKAASTVAWGHRVSMPAPFRKMPRRIWA